MTINKYVVERLALCAIMCAYMLYLGWCAQKIFRERSILQIGCWSISAFLCVAGVVLACLTI